MPHINIEIKARCSNQEQVKTWLTSQSAEYQGRDHQIDIYFNSQNGRLKLRKGTIEKTLIYYERENELGPKQSNVILFETDSEELEAMLRKSMGVLVEVDKQREIYFLGNVKFHLDCVKDLGQFVEIEAIDKEGNIGRDRLLEQCQFFQKQFRIKPEDLIDKSYSDLLLGKN